MRKPGRRGSSIENKNIVNLSGGKTQGGLKSWKSIKNNQAGGRGELVS